MEFLTKTLDFPWLVHYSGLIPFHDMQRIEEWLHNNVGIKSEDWTYGSNGWRFNTEADATLFQLAWE